MAKEEEVNSVCSEDTKEEELEVKDVPDGCKDENDDDDDDEDEEEDEEDEEDDEDDEDEDDDEEFDPTIIQYELFKNFLTDEDGNNVASHLGSIAKELRTLNKILLKKNK